MSENFTYSSFFDESYFGPGEAYAFEPEQNTISLDELLHDPTSSNFIGPDFFASFAENALTEENQPITTSVSEAIVQPQTAQTEDSHPVANSEPTVNSEPTMNSEPTVTYAGNSPASFTDHVTDKTNSSIDVSEVVENVTTPQQSALPPVASNGLRFTSVAEAQQFAEARTPLAVTNDDWAAMEANPQPHILKIMAAFSGELRPEPEKYVCNNSRLAEWAVYQARNLDRVNKIARQDPSRTELAAWLIFGELIDAHKYGAKPAKANTTAQPAPAPTKCSIHLDALCQPIRDYAIFRFDLLRLTRIDELISNVEGAKTRKLSNFKGNGRKAERDVQNADRAAEMGFDYKKVLGSKRKRGEGEGESDEGMKKVKKTKNRAAAVDEKDMGLGEYAGFSGSGSLSPAEGDKSIKMAKKTKKQAPRVDQGGMGFWVFGGFSAADLFDTAAVGGVSVGDVGAFTDTGLFDPAAIGGAQSSDVFGVVGGMSLGNLGGGMKRKDSVITTE